MLDRTAAITRRFQLVLIKPSHYDDDGYVIQWAQAFVPSNTLAIVYSLGRDAALRKVLGSDTEIDITVIDEIHSRVKIGKLLKLFKRHNNFGMVGIVGAQSNQFPRALDIARPFRQAGIPVVVGGFHVSGVLAMIPKLDCNLQDALDMGVSLFAGELEGRMDDLLRDAAAGELKPIYNYLKDLPSLESEPTPILPPEQLKRAFQQLASFDAGRGCPYQCSFCVIINVQGRKSRRRSPDDVERTIREHWEHNIRHFFITDDNFARNKDWEGIFDRIIEMRERDKMNIRLIMQVDTLCHKIPGFIEKATRAGVTRVLLGLESINAANLLAASKRQNKITEYRKMLLAWKKSGVITIAGYILCFPEDTPESIREDIQIVQKELPLDILEFFILTPLPGSEDHKVLWTKKEWMHEDLNFYDGEHAVTNHGKMTHAQMVQVYRDAWTQFYTPEHMLTMLRRGAATGCSMWRLLTYILLGATSVPVENAHPLQGGLLRRKYRRDRRPGMALESAFVFYPKYAFEFASKTFRQVRLLMWLNKQSKKIQADPKRYEYMDTALTPVTDDELDKLELFTHNDTARKAVQHVQKVAHLTHAHDQKPEAATAAGI